MTRIARPTAGEVSIRGSVGALIEVGSGIHPDLTGRENIWLYGQIILGVPKADIARRFDEIVEFSELSQALDQQVKFYSSGMQLRLGFSIAAHIEPDVLIVDEALAVGDLRFQRRCIDRMRSFVDSGTTVVYVSHDVRTVEALCTRVLWLDNGSIVAVGDTKDVLGDYVDSRGFDAEVPDQPDDAPLKVTGVSIRDGAGNQVERSERGVPVEVWIDFEGDPIERPHVAVGFTNGGPHPFAVCSMTEHGTAPERVGERWRCRLAIRELPLRRGRHELWCGVLASDGMADILGWRRIGSVQIEAEVAQGPRGLTEVGPVALDHSFAVEERD